MRAGLRCPPASRPLFCLAVNDKKNTPETIIADPSGLTWGSVQLYVDERNEASFHRVVELLNALRPACVTSKPSVLEQLGTVGPDRRGAPDTAPSSHGLKWLDAAPKVREAIGRSLRTRVIDAYTMTEFGLIASECSHGEMHVDATSLYVEVVNGSNRRLRDGGASW